MESSEEPLRQRFCRGAGCGAIFWICRSCDRGQQYCSDRCRKKARRHQRREANRRHQQSREGRLDHRDRQRAYRHRRREARVTDPSSPVPLASESIPAAEPVRPTNGSDHGFAESRYAEFTGFEPICRVCGCRRRFVDPFIDWG
jgi:hypothetical protein